MTATPQSLLPPCIGCVRYLNSKPLIYGHEEGVSFETPASLAEGLHNGRLDVALAPIFELLAHPGYLVVDDVAIASDGPVYSVVIAYQGDLNRLHTLYLDPASRTSVNLQKVVLAEFHKLNPASRLFAADDPPATLPAGEGALLIGDLALDFRLRHSDEYQYLDLGEAWQTATGLPFVFAAWLMRPDVPYPRVLAEKLRTWRQQGTQAAAVAEIAAREPRYPGDLTRRYLTEHIRFGLGAPEKAAMREFARLLHKHGLVENAPYPEPQWV